MRLSSDLVFGVSGQSLRHLVRGGRPTSATFAVFDAENGDDGTAEFSGTATVDSVNTVLAAAAGVGQVDTTSITLASGTGVTPGRRYLLSENGAREWVQVVSVDGAAVVASAPLAGSYSTAATFVGTELEADVDDAWIADSGNLSDPSDTVPTYRVRWVVLVGGETQVHYTFFDVSRGALGHGVTMADVEARLWNSIDDLPTDHRKDQGQRIIDAAWIDLRVELAGNLINESALRDAELVDSLLIKRVRLAFATNGHLPRSLSAEATLADAREDYQRFYERHFAAAPMLAIAASTSSAAGRQAKRLFRK